MEPRLISSNDYSLEEKISFFELANVRFGIDFSSWEQAGEWNRHYTCYSYTGEEKILSNVGLHEMTLLIDDVPTPAYQIGTVMTDPAFEGQGLAKAVMHHVLSETSNQTRPYFLASDQGVEPFYEQFGFVVQPEVELFLPVRGDAEPLEKVSITLEQWRRFKLESVPFSPRLYVQNDLHVWTFYYFQGMGQHVYQIDDTVVVYTIDGTSLHLYAVLTQQMIHWEKIIERLSFKGVTEIIFEFTPDLDVLRRDSTDGNWMVRTPTFPLWPPTLRFPTLSRT